jgi:hypothetical protein
MQMTEVSYYCERKNCNVNAHSLVRNPPLAAAYIDLSVTPNFEILGRLVDVVLFTLGEIHLSC